MASTFSPTLRIELIGDGDQSGIWGQTTNINLGSLIEQAITGVQSITMVDANYTLTSFNGVVDEARNAVLVVGGTNSQVRDIIAPLAEKLYVIRNNTVGGFAINIRASTGSSVSIPNGSTVWVYCDGTNFVNGLSGTSGNFSVNGALSVTGTTSLAGSLSGTTAAFSGAISSVSPAFTGTPTAPTASPGTSTTQIATTAFVQNVAGSLGTMSTQNANNIAITGGVMSSVSGSNPGMSVGSATSAINATNATTATNATQFQGKSKLGLGITGEVWSNVTGSRVANNTYTNSNSYPIMFAVSALKDGAVNTQGFLEMVVNGSVITQVQSRVGNNIDHSTVVLSSSAIVPPGQTYRANLNGTTYLQIWNELS